MTIYIVTIILIVTLQPILQLLLGPVKYKNIYVFLIGTWLFLVLALRSESVGSDLPAYVRYYSIFGNTSWNNLAEVAKISDMEIGYAALCKLMYFLSDNPRVLIVAVSFFIIYVLSREIKQKSKNPAFSYFLYIAMGMYVRAFTGYRQQIAATFVLIAYNFIQDKKPIKFLIVILAASMIHKSSLFVLPMYFIAHIKVDYKVYFSIFIGCILCFTVGDRILSYITYKERYTEMIAQGSGGAVGACLIFSGIIVLIVLIQQNFKTLETRTYMHFSIFCLLISCLTFVLPITARMLYHFDLMMLFAVPNTVSQLRNISTRYAIIFGVCAVTLFYYLIIICQADTGSVIPYIFYWEQKI